METSPRVRPIECFTFIYKVLAMAGFYKHLVKPKSYWKYVVHQMYRPVGFLIPVLYNLVHLIYIYQTSNDIDKILEVLTIEIPQLNLLTKYLTWNLSSSRIDRINDALANEPLLQPSNKKDEEFLMAETLKITAMTKRIFALVAVTDSLWATSYFVRRLWDPEAQLKFYLPFATNHWLRYSIAVILYTFAPALWTVYGHIAYDCAIAAYYSQAHTQLRIIRHNLERLAQTEDSAVEMDVNISNEDVTSESRLQYRDLVDPNLRESFIHCVKRYEKVVWYIEEVDRVLDKAIGLNFFATSLGLSLIVSFMSSADVYILQIGFLVTFSIALMTQVFIYCYFGGLVAAESSLLNTSIYMSNWYSLSPSFRREMLVAMVRWSRPLVPRVHSFVVVPLSLGTFIVIVRSAYSLFTVLKAAKSQ